MISLFTAYIYQPFFNILVGIYWALSQITDQPDMGIAVIIFAIIIRLVMLPLSLVSDRSASEKKEIIEKVEKARKEFAHDPVRLRIEEKRLLRSSPMALISETFIILVQVIILLMLYRIFKTGLFGADFHLLYDFMPDIPRPINLMFLGQYDLSRPNLTLNLIQSLAILTLESFSVLFSVNKVSHKEFLSLVIFMPLASFFIFAVLPAGKKVFIITTLAFSLTELLIKQLVFWYNLYLTPGKKQA